MILCLWICSEIYSSLVYHFSYSLIIWLLNYFLTSSTQDFQCGRPVFFHESSPDYQKNLKSFFLFLLEENRVMCKRNEKKNQNFMNLRHRCVCFLSFVVETVGNWLHRCCASISSCVNRLGRGVASEVREMDFAFS